MTGMTSDSGAPEAGRSRRRHRLACAAVLAMALAATVPTTGDIGLTWDEPAYRYSQVISSQWWERLAKARSWSEARPLFEADALLYYWPYGRHGINFHPPLAGQLSLATHALFGRWMKDIPSRRMASVIEYALTITLAFGFLSRRYGPWVGAVASGALLLMPRVYGDGHIAGTDTPGLLLWPLTAIACWKGLDEPGAGRWRAAVGVLVGLAFVEKMGAVFVVLPILLWLALARLPRARSRADWIDAAVTIPALLAPILVAFAEILRLAAGHHLPRPKFTDLFYDRPASALPGAILAVPFLVWLARRLAGRAFRHHPTWGAERPGLETFASILAFGPLVGWLGNPAWWRETMPRLAHYYMLNTDRRGSLPDIQIIYFGQTYEYSLPWHNAWVLIGITVPASILAASVAGLFVASRRLRADRLPLFFFANLVTPPVLRMLPTPAHDGVRLFLPTFFFLAAFAGWGAVGVADGLARLVRGRRAVARAAVSALVLGPSAWQLARVHPFELSYYNELIGGPRGAWDAGFEPAYWYDSFNGPTLDALNRKLPRGAAVDFLNELTAPPTFHELQTLGEFRGDLTLGSPSQNAFPYVWLQTQDSKALAFTRLLFAMRPWFAVAPRQLDGVRVATVAAPESVSRAWALRVLADAPDARPSWTPRSAPEWVHRRAPWLARFWGEGITHAPRLRVNEPAFDWARTDPDGLRAAARKLAARRPPDDDARRLRALLDAYGPRHARGWYAGILFQARPQALVEAVEILIRYPDAVRTVLLRYPYTDPDRIGGYLDRDFPGPEPEILDGRGGWWRGEGGGKRTEGREQRAEGREQREENRGKRTEGREQMTDDRLQMTDDR